jgi:spore germination protein GerM
LKGLRLYSSKVNHLQATNALMYFLNHNHSIKLSDETMKQFAKLDDTDIYAAIKTWSDHKDVVLSHLCANDIKPKFIKN